MLEKSKRNFKAQVLLLLRRTRSLPEEILLQTQLKLFSSSWNFFQIARVFWQQIQAHRIILVEKNPIFFTACLPQAAVDVQVPIFFSFLFFSFLFCFAATLYLVLFHLEFNARFRIFSQKLTPKNTKNTNKLKKI